MMEIIVQEKTINPTKRPLVDALQLTRKTFFVDLLSDILCVHLLPIFSQMRKNNYVKSVKMHNDEPDN
jgi:hypothetical protein